MEVIPTAGPFKVGCADRAVEGCVAEGKDGSIGRYQPITPAIGRGGDGDDGLGRAARSQRTMELGVAEGEDSPVGPHQPVTSAIGRGGDADYGLLQVPGTGEPWGAASPKAKTTPAEDASQ